MSLLVINFLSFEMNKSFATSLKNSVISITNVISNAYSEIFLFNMHDTKFVVN
jgi:hypothetical protein